MLPRFLAIHFVFLPLKKVYKIGEKYKINLKFPEAKTKLYGLLPLVNGFRNKEIEIDFSLENIKTVFEACEPGLVV
jgi:hypothetical protein